MVCFLAKVGDEVPLFIIYTVNMILKGTLEGTFLISETHFGKHYYCYIQYYLDTIMCFILHLQNDSALSNFIRFCLKITFLNSPEPRLSSRPLSWTLYPLAIALVQ